MPFNPNLPQIAHVRDSLAGNANRIWSALAAGHRRMMPASTAGRRNGHIVRMGAVSGVMPASGM